MRKVLNNLRNFKLIKFIAKTSNSYKILAVFILLACGPSPQDFGEYFSLFYPESANFPEQTKPYFYTPMLLNTESEIYVESPMVSEMSPDVKENVASWYDYFQGKVGREVIKNGLYGEKRTLGFAKYINNLNSEASKYLEFSQEVEKETPFYTFDWEKPESIDTLKLLDLNERAKNEFLLTTDDFLKERYLFQYVKLSAINGKYQEILTEYPSLLKQIKNKTFISDWSFSRLAGSKMAIGDTAQAVFDFAQLFSRSVSRRSQADLSVRRLNTKFFESALKFCKNDKEKANIYALNAIQPFQDGLTLAMKIYSIDANHPILELVIAREINKNEMLFFSEKNSNIYAAESFFLDDKYSVDEAKIKAGKKKGESYLNEILDFTSQVSKDSKVKSKQFWDLASAYLYYLDGEEEKANLLLSSFQNSSNTYIRKQAAFLQFEFLNKTLNKENEAALISKLAMFTKVDNFRDNNMLVKMSETLYKFYANEPKDKKSWGWFSSCSKTKERKHGNQVKAFLALNIGATKSEGYGYQVNKSQDFYTDSCSVGFLKEVISFVKNSSNSKAEKSLISYANLETDYLLLALGRRQIKEGDYESALQTFQSISPDYLNQIGFQDYFKAEPKDFKVKSAINNSSVLDFLKELVSLKQKTEDNIADAATWFQYGKNLYNLSYFGQAWILSSRHKSEYDLQYEETKSLDFYSTDEARKCFDKALSLKPEAELAARICYAGALCERNQYLVKFYANQPEDYDKHEGYTAEMIKNELPKFRSYFNKLWQNYRTTQYHKEVLKECITYSDFVR